MKEALCTLRRRSVSATRQLVQCSGCTVCCERGGYVYVQEEEVSILRGLGVPMFSEGGVSVIRRLPDGSCPMLDREQNRCSIYADRPLCCRLFPLDMVRVDGQLVWGVSNQCPRKNLLPVRAGKPPKHIDYGTGAGIAAQLDILVDGDLMQFMDRKEKVVDSMELLDEDVHHWTQVGVVQGITGAAKKVDL